MRVFATMLLLRRTAGFLHSTSRRSRAPLLRTLASPAAAPPAAPSNATDTDAYREIRGARLAKADAMRAAGARPRVEAERC